MASSSPSTNIPPSRPRLLICGFGAFPGMPDNPSARIVERLDREAWAPAGWTTAFATIPTTWTGAFEAIVTARQDASAVAVLVIGVAPGAAALRVETLARNHCGEARPDAAGADRTGPAISAHGPAVAPATIPAQAMVAAIAAEGLPVEMSQDAGDYLCNFVFYRLVTEVASTPAAFLHVPPVGVDGAAPSLDDLERGAKAVATALTGSLRDKTRRQRTLETT